MGRRSRRDFLRQGSAALALSLLKPAPYYKEEDGGALKPKALQKGDTVAITSPAGAVWDDKSVETFNTVLCGFGFKVKFGQTLKEKWGYFAGSDELRAKELMQYFTDPDVRGIFCAKGGWGCARILPMLDYDVIQKNPKVLIGFSDITSLLLAVYKQTGHITFHGPVGNSGWNDFSSSCFSKVVMDKQAPAFDVVEQDNFIGITAGKATGKLIGGNLNVLTSIIGSDYLPSFKGKILFLEEVMEEPYRIDRMLTQLKLAGILNEISGFVFGRCVKCEAEFPDKAFTFRQVIEQHIRPLSIPAFYGANIGHIENKLTLPIGINAEMDAEKGTIKLLGQSVT